MAACIHLGGFNNPIFPVICHRGEAVGYSRKFQGISLLFAGMLLILGDSYAAHLARQCARVDGVEATGRRGARVGDESFRAWAVREVVRRQPRLVVLIVGSNDVALPAFRQGQLRADLNELALGALAAGAEAVAVFPIPPRIQLRPRDISRSAYQQRRRLANRLLRIAFQGADIFCPEFRFPSDFLGSDGVHPSRRGWQALLAGVCRLV